MVVKLKKIKLGYGVGRIYRGKFKSWIVPKKKKITAIRYKKRLIKEYPKLRFQIKKVKIKKL